MSPRGRDDRGDREDEAAQEGDRRPGRCVQLHREENAGGALDRAQHDGRELPGAHAGRPEAGRGRRDHEQRGDEQGADRGHGRRGREGDEPQQRRLEPAGERALALGVEAMGDPVMSGDDGCEERRGGDGPGQRQIGPVDEQQAPEQQGVERRRRVEDVAREDHAEREHPDEDHGDLGSPIVGASAGEQGDKQGERGRRAKRAEGGGEAKPFREDEPGEGGCPNRVGVKGEAAQDDPGPDQPRADGEQEHLGQAALDEGQVERLEHVPSIHQ